MNDTELINSFETAFLNDEEPDYKKQEQLLKLYCNSTLEQRKIIDNIIVALCGSSIPTLVKSDIHIPEPPEEEVPNLFY